MEQTPTWLNQLSRPSEAPTQPVDNQAGDVPSWLQGLSRPSPTASQGLSQKDLIENPSNLASIRHYMISRKGVEYEKKSPEEVVDDYITHMRYVNAGEIPLVGEIYYLHNLNEADKEQAKKAFDSYEQLNPFWEEGVGESLDALKDYSLAVINPLSSPSTFIGAGVGKLASSTAGKKLGMEALKAVFVDGASTALQKASAKAALKKAGMKATAVGVGAGALTDASMGALSDAMYQTGIEQVYDPSKEYDAYQTLLTGALVGGLSSIVGAAPLLREGKTLGITGLDIKEINNQATIKALNKAQGRLVKTVGKISKGLPKDEWEKAAARGEVFNLSEKAKNAFIDSFVDLDDPDSIASILKTSGVKMRFDEGETISGFVNYLKNMPQPILDPIKNAWEANINVPWEQGLDHLIRAAQDTGRTQYKFSRVNKELQEWVTNSITAQQKQDAKKNPEYLRYIQSLWKRAVVSAIPTTSVNVQGWGVASAMRAADDLTEIFTRPTMGAVISAFQGSPTALKKGLTDSKAIAENMAFRARVFMDPFASKDVWDAAWENAPKNIKNLVSRDTFGGVATNNPAQQFHMPDNKFFNSVETISELGSKLTAIDLQDRYTRAISGIIEMDKQSRLAFGKSYTQLVRDGEAYKFTDEMYSNVARTALEDTFSFDYAKGKDVLNRMARLVQTASDTPIVGFALPFGKFMNNIVAFSASHSPLGAWEVGKQMLKGNTDDATTALSKAIAGSAIMGTIGYESYKSMKENGDQWYEMGDRDVSNLAPIAQQAIVGRMFWMGVNGDSIPLEMVTEAAKQLAVGEYAGAVGAPKALTEFVNSWRDADESGRAAFDTMWQEMAKTIGSIGAGFTRPLDTVNDVVFGQDQNTLLDRRMARSPKERFVLELTRYVDNIVAPIIGPEEYAPKMGATARQASRPEGDINSPNPFSEQLGAKLLQTKNYTDYMLGTVNLPPFKIDSRTAIPEFDRIINEQMAPELNERARVLLKTPAWKTATQAGRLTLAKNLVSKVKEDVITRIESMELGYDPAVQNQRRLFSTKESALRAEAKKAFGWQDIPDRELSWKQIESLNIYIQDKKDNNKIIIDAIE